jgi:hypothetical protein
MVRNSAEIMATRVDSYLPEIRAWQHMLER